MEQEAVMRLIDADVLVEGRVENDPVVIATKCAQTGLRPGQGCGAVRRGKRKCWLCESHNGSECLYSGDQ